ncbi:MAG TPA: hypothetical protein DCL54_00475, partial [Alphaproteobacteria bacterium]|nr:hypothetical protein [Alphaproteobacteria bacterium]
LPVERVGEEIYRMLTIGSPPVRVALAPSYFFDWWLPSSLPKRWVDAAFRSRLGLKLLPRKKS